jgi:hypothetical protein
MDLVYFKEPNENKLKLQETLMGVGLKCKLRSLKVLLFGIML